MTAARPLCKALLRSLPKTSKGAALLVMLFLILATFGTIIVSQLSKANLEMQMQKKTQETLAQAKQALIAWSVLNGDVGTNTLHRPGALPCPADPATPGLQKSSCASATGSAIGRLPWKTLGIDELRDAYGEDLWYSVSDSFRPAPPNLPAINSDSQGTMLLYASNGSTLLTPVGDELAAIVFSAGPPIAAQNRNAGPDSVANYLDAGNGWNNATAGGPFISGPAKDSSGNTVVNDLTIGLSARELINAVEKRVLEEAKIALANFFAANGKYPNPANPNDPGCTSPISSVKNPPTCASDNAVCFGRFPDVLPPSLQPSTWFRPNGWGRVITYALNDSGAGCTNTLKVDGMSKSYVLVAPGTALAGQTRPSANLADYLEDSANKDAWSADPNFSTPSAISNDQLRSYP